MAQISLRVDDDVKRGAERAAYPLELSADPFYSESNLHYFDKKMEDYKAGRLNFSEHELIEE